MKNFIDKYKCLATPEPRPASFSHALWALLVVGLITKLTYDKGVPMFILGAWLFVVLATLKVSVSGTLKHLRGLLIADAMIASVLLSLLIFSDVTIYSYSGTEDIFSPHVGYVAEKSLFYFELSILAGQTVFAAYLAKITHAQILERLRMELLK